MGSHLCYLLHFEREKRGKLHYFGVTTAERLDKRMLEHARGEGASITRHLVRQGVGFYLARVFPGRGYEYEQAVKASGRIKALCPICRAGQRELPMQGRFFRANTAFNGSVMIDWPEPAPKASLAQEP